jgi:hypothetical protein
LPATKDEINRPPYIECLKQHSDVLYDDAFLILGRPLYKFYISNERLSEREAFFILSISQLTNRFKK